MLLQRLFKWKTKSPKLTEAELRQKLLAWVNVPSRKAYYEQEIAGYANGTKGLPVKNLNQDVKTWLRPYGEQQVKAIAQIEKRLFIFRWYSRWRYGRKHGSYKLAYRLATLYSIDYVLKNREKLAVRDKELGTEEGKGTSYELQLMANEEKKQQKEDRKPLHPNRVKQKNKHVASPVTKQQPTPVNASSPTLPPKQHPSSSNDKSAVPKSDSKGFYLVTKFKGMFSTKDDSKQTTKTVPKTVDTTVQPSCSSQMSADTKLQPSQQLIALPYGEDDKTLAPFFSYIDFMEQQEKTALDKLDKTLWDKNNLVKSLKEARATTDVKIHYTRMKRQVTKIRLEELGNYSKLIDYALSQLQEPPTVMQHWRQKVHLDEKPINTLPETVAVFQQQLQELSFVSRARKESLPSLKQKDIRLLFHPDKTYETEAERVAADERAEQEKTAPSDTLSPLTRKDVTTEAWKDYQRVLEVWRRNLEIKPLEDVTEQCRELLGERTFKQAGLHRRYKRVLETGSENDKDNVCLLTDLAALVYNGQRKVLARLSQKMQSALLLLGKVLDGCDALEKAVEEVKILAAYADEMKKHADEMRKYYTEQKYLSDLIETIEDKPGPRSEEDQKTLNALEEESASVAAKVAEILKEYKANAQINASSSDSTNNTTEPVSSSMNGRNSDETKKSAAIPEKQEKINTDSHTKQTNSHSPAHFQPAPNSGNTVINHNEDNQPDNSHSP